MSGTSDEEGFLTRWSRRKREIAREDDAKPVADAVSPLPSIRGGEESGMGGRAGPGTALDRVEPPHHSNPSHRKQEEEDERPEPEPMIEPPSLDLVDKDFDVAHWLKQNVPESWKLAALRRAWETDPAIRDFENPARDYALDWNTPGGAPGYGPLAETDDVEAMVRDIFGPDPEPPKVMAEAAGDSMPHELSSNEERHVDDAAGQQKTPDAPEMTSVRLSEATSRGQDTGVLRIETVSRAETDFAAVQNNTAGEPEKRRIRKRGGGAVPG